MRDAPPAQHLQIDCVLQLRIEAAGRIEREVLNARIHLIYFVTVQKEGSLGKGWERFRNAQKEFSRLQQLVTPAHVPDSTREKVERRGRDIDTYHSILERIIGVVKRKENHGAEFDALLNEWARLGGAMVETAGRLSRDATQRTTESATQAAVRLHGAAGMLGGACAIALLTALMIAVFLRRQITRVLNQLAAKMAQSAEQVATAAVKVTGSSHSVANGASEQAASVENTTVSVHQLTVLTQQNTKRTNDLLGIMKEVGAASRVKDALMEELVTWADATYESGQKVAQIIRVIDEIAFQTNILALNAAIEAARAGNAGSGFAVVADEVRNLAGRSAEAARQTSELIQKSVEGSARGHETINKCQQAGTTTTQLGKRVAQLASEICQATAEQARGIESIEQMLRHVETNTQATAASAEESASASKGLNGQAEAMRHIVSELSGLI